MTCEHCENAVTSELMKVPGVTGVSITLKPGDTSLVTVTADQDLDTQLLAEAIDEAGYELAE